MSPRRERALVRGAQAGDAAAVEELYAAHWPACHRAAYLVTKDEHAAQDIAQESFLAAMKSIDRFDRERPLGPWLKTITARRAIDHTRRIKARRERNSDDTERAAPPSSSADAVRPSTEVLKALANLEQHQREAVVLRHLLELTPTEIATLTGVPVGTVNSRIRRGLDALRQAVVPLVIALTAAAIALTPPGDAVATFIKRVVGADAPKPTPLRATTTLPGTGRLLIAGRGGTFAIGGGRPATRFFGDTSQATWSAHGRFVAATRGIELIAVSLKGDRHWSLHQPRAIRDPAWDQNDGYRIAYRSGGRLWIVNGDGTGNRAVASAWPVAPVFRPHATHEIAYAQADGAVVVLRMDTGKEILHTAPRLHPRALAWSPDGKRLLALSREWLWITPLNGHFLRRAHVPAGSSNLSAAWAPSGSRYAVLRRTRSGISQVILNNHVLFRLRTPLAGLLWSPDGRWIVTASHRADQWLFLHPDAHGRLTSIRTISNVKRRFGGGHAATLQGWIGV